jgi:holo-[acyl-carrier protein] synthase
VTVVGIGVDIVDVERFTRSLIRTPRLADRLLTEAEQQVRRPERLAARFAAKEALAKALGAPSGLCWHDAEVVADPAGQPRFVLSGSVAAAARAVGARSWHLSLSHDGGVATAFVVLDSGPVLGDGGADDGSEGS